jgi:hypothetical protein
MENANIRARINSIYDQYSIPINLRNHMINVAAVAELLCDNCKELVDKEAIIETALIHDLGNFIKMDFSKKTQYIFDERDIPKIPFFKEKQKEFIAKYGGDTNKANIKIAKEINAPSKVIKILENDLYKLDETKLKNLDAVIFYYSDLRVSPTQITSMQERTDEYAKRYNILADKTRLAYSEKFVVFAKKLEIELFKKMKIAPSDVNTNSCAKYVEKYKVKNL